MSCTSSQLVHLDLCLLFDRALQLLIGERAILGLLLQPLLLIRPNLPGSDFRLGLGFHGAPNRKAPNDVFHDGLGSGFLAALLQRCEQVVSSALKILTPELKRQLDLTLVTVLQVQSELMGLHVPDLPMHECRKVGDQLDACLQL